MARSRSSRKQSRGECDDYVFSGGKANQPLSNMAMLALLKRMKRTDLTVHGFRSTFRDWAAAATLMRSASGGAHAKKT
jgi:integrase